MPNVGSGKFRHKLIWSQKGKPIAQHGGDAAIYTPQPGLISAQIERLRGADLISAQQQKSIATFKVTLRRSTTTLQIRTADRLLFPAYAATPATPILPALTATFEIVSILPDFASNAFLEFMVSESIA